MAKAKKYKTVTITKMRVSPKQAKEWLTTRKNSRQRYIRGELVVKYADALVRGQWKLNGDTIVFDWFGNLLNGSHRCKAIEKAQIPMETFIVFGIDPDNFHTIDGGARRTLADHLIGEPYPNHLAAALVTLDSFEHSRMIYEGRRIKFQYKDALMLYGKNENIVNFMPKASSEKAKAIIATSISTAFHYIISKYESKKKADNFFNSLFMGHSFRGGVNDPIYRLRELLLINKTKKVGKYRRNAKIALLIKAWNAHTKGELVTALSWRDPKNPKEVMPTMILNKWKNK